MNLDISYFVKFHNAYIYHKGLSWFSYFQSKWYFK